jgi:hypothetical protein
VLRGSTRKEEDRIGLDGGQNEVVRTSDLSDCAIKRKWKDI